MNSATTLDHVAFHAARSPDAVALICDGRRVTYRAFLLDGWKFIRALRQFGLPPGRTVAIAHAHPYIHLLLIVACEELGIVSASFDTQEGPRAQPLLSYVDLVLSEVALDGLHMKRFHLLSAGWIQDTLNASGTVEPPGGADRADVPRIARSSGTTRRKMMLRGTNMTDVRISGYLYDWPMHERHFLIAYPFSVYAVYRLAIFHLRIGATCVAGPIMESLRDYPITLVFALPRDLERLLGRLPEAFPKPRNLTVATGGGAASRTLRDGLRKRLATRVVESYSSNETGRIATIGEDGTGFVFPGVDVEIVDERDERLPVGQPGAIRVRSPDMVDGYLEDPEATALQFRGGWFYPGDTGVLIAPRRLKVLGRSDEMLNLGGEKHAPAAIEDPLKTMDALADVGVTTITNADGADVLCVAAVLRPGADPGKVAAVIEERMLRITNKYVLGFCDALPRTATGKLQRHLLKDTFARRLRDGA